jgi:uncharacterized protein
MNAHVKRAVALSVGWGFILVGIVGLFLPVLQGVLFLFAGLVILSSEYVWAHRLIVRLRQRFPKFGRVVDEAAIKAAGWLRRRKPD